MQKHVIVITFCPKDQIEYSLKMYLDDFLLLVHPASHLVSFFFFYFLNDATDKGIGPVFA